MKLLYKPLSIISRVIASRVGKVTYRTLWSRIDEGDPPATTEANASFGKVLQAAVLEAATMSAFAAIADRASARTFHYVFGVWPGESSEEESSDSKKR